MPFQLSQIIVSQKKVSPLILKSVGDDELITCQILITLQAVVQGDVLGHDLLWEQIQGVPVLWMTPQTNLTAQYQQLDTDDKLFRFWIDKGTANEQFADVWHYNTPIDYEYTADVIACTASVELCGKLNRSDLVIRPIANENSGTCSSDKGELTFITPCNAEHIKQFDIQRFVIGVGWVTIDTILGTHAVNTSVYSYEPIFIDESYRVVVVYNNQNSTYNLSNPNIESESVSLQNTGPVGNSTEIFPQQSNNEPTINNYVFTPWYLTTKSYVDSYIFEENNISALIQGYNVIERVLRIYPDILTDKYIFTNNSTLPLISSYSVLERDGGSIGG